jgi:hypothetical protein
MATDAAPYKSAEGKDLRERGRRWITRINAAGTAEKGWMRDAERAVRIYTASGGQGSSEGVASGSQSYDFNILFANVETIVPAVINSPPQPDIRRRFGDPDPVAKDVAEIIERSIRVQVDDSRLQVELESSAQDGFLAGRGVVRLRFFADDEGDGDELKRLAEDAREIDRDGNDDGTKPVSGAAEPSGQPELGSSDAKLTNERIAFEAVSWRDYRHGPAKRWADRPWDAFRHSIPMEDIEGFADNALFDSQTLPEDKILSGDTDNDVVVWEVWNKKDRTVYFIEEETGRILKRVKDPLGWSGFFPIATPIQPIEINGRLMPVNPFAIYSALADELDITSRRINVITNKMRVKGWYPGSATDIQNMVSAEDDEFVPIADAEIWAQNGGLQGAVAFWPAEKYAQVLLQLFTQREQTKQAIYEITGISDIIRGASVAAETATAQQIKTQWGSLRVQKFQRMIERAARDLFVMMSEVIPAKFSDETLEQMTQVQLIPTQQDQQPLPPPQPTGDQQQDAQAQQQYQAAEQGRQAKLQKLAAIKDMLKKPLQRFYRIDVESDSTVRADLTRQKAEVGEFLQGAAAYWGTVGPLVQEGVFSMKPAAEIFASNARMFNLGKTVEDALDEMIGEAEKSSGQPKPPSAEEQKAQSDMQRAQMDAQTKQADAQARQAEAQAQMQAIQAKSQADIAKVNADVQAKQQDAQIKGQEMQAQMLRDQQSHAIDMQKGTLELRKIEAEIEKIRVGTAGQIATTNAKVEMADRAQTLKEQQAKETAA